MSEKKKKNVRLTRATAERLLSEIKGRAEEINQDDELAYYVARLWVFGSYRDPSRERLGDLDLIYELRQRVLPGEDPRRWNERFEAAAGRSPWGGVLEAFWPQTEVLRRLKGRSRALSLHPLHLHDPAEYKGQLVYEYEINSLEARPPALAGE